MNFTSERAGGFHGHGEWTFWQAAVQTYEMAADVASASSLSIKMTLLEGSPWLIADSDFRSTLWDDPTLEPGQRLFVPRFPGRNETRLLFRGGGRARIDYYECGSLTPTRTEVMVWNGP